MTMLLSITLHAIALFLAFLLGILLYEVQKEMRKKKKEKNVTPIKGFRCYETSETTR